MHELLHFRGNSAGHVWVGTLVSVGCIFSQLTLISQEIPEMNPLVPHMLVDPEDDRGICHEFFTEAVSRFQEDDMAQKALVGAVEDLSRQLATMTMNENYKPYVLVSDEHSSTSSTRCELTV